MAGFPLVPGGTTARSIVERQAAGGAANAGLVWERYFPLWLDAGGEIQRGQGSGAAGGQATLDAFAKTWNAGRKAVDDRLRAHNRRFARALDALARSRGLTARTVELRLNERFASGLGNPHPTGNGFTFDPAAGVPCIAGAAVKGLCRAAAGEEGWSAARIAAMFGQDLAAVTADERTLQGSVVFFDAFPTEAPRLGVDIVNCHHMDHYAGKRPPRETDDPNPVFFLVVEKGAVFRFPVLAPAAEADAIMDLLEGALGWLGIGAKTATGYGVFGR